MITFSAGEIWGHEPFFKTKSESLYKQCFNVFFDVLVQIKRVSRDFDLNNVFSEVMDGHPHTFF